MSIQISFLEKMNDLIGNLILATIAALIRLIFTLDETSSFRISFLMFSGGILTGVLAGILISDLHWSNVISNGVVALSAMSGREIFKVLLKQIPIIFQRLLLYYAQEKTGKKKDGQQDNTDSSSNG